MTARTFALDDLGDPYAPIGTRPWALHISNEIRKTLYDKQQTGSRLSRLIDMFKEKGGYQELGFLTWEQFCESRLQITAEKLAVEATDRVIAAANNHRDLMTKEEIGEMGKNNTRNDNHNDGLAQGTSSEYLTARIARDHPAILEDMKQGKYRSVRAAAIDAGIVDPEKTRRFQLPTDPVAAGRYLAYRVDKDWLMECVDAYFKEGNHEKDT